MTAIQLSLPSHQFDRLTPFDRALLKAIYERADAQGGEVSSLFDVAVNYAGLSYWWSLYRLEWLEMLGYLTVTRRGPGRALIIRPLAGGALWTKS